MRLLTDNEIAQRRQRRQQPTFAAAWAALVDTADRALALRVTIPTEGAGWWHNYFCPDHAAQLIYDPEQPHAHRCPVDGHIFSGEPYDGAWRSRTQHVIVDGLYAAALAWLLGGDERYAHHATVILRTYAAHYPYYPVHGEHAGKGRCMGQSLDEAVWSIPLAWAYDVMRDTLAPDLRAQIERDLLRPVAEHLMTQLWQYIHNIQCWHLAGLATLGVVLDDARYVAPALAGDYGLPGQLREGVLDDGWWWEGSPNYHFYTLQAVTALALALRRQHSDVLAAPRLGAMLRAPLELARADRSLPATNDGWFDEAAPNALGSHAASYEAAWNLWHDPAHAAFLSRVYAAGTPRNTPEALLFGPADLPPAETPARPSVLHAASGYAMLRGGTGDRECALLLKYGPHGGGHGHPDKLALDLHACGQRLAPDLGTPGYGIPLNRVWYRHTLAHNTALLDATPQPPATGRLLRFSAANNALYAVADASVAWPDDAPAPYAGATMRRCILWRPGDTPYFLDIVQVRCAGDAPHQIDLAWHHQGALDVAGLTPATLPAANETYALLNNVQRIPGQSWHGVWRAENASTACWALDPPGSTAYATHAPYNPAAETMSLVLRRAEASTATFAALFAPFSDEPVVRQATWTDRSAGGTTALTVLVEGDGWRDAWVVGSAPRDPAHDPPAFADATVREHVLAQM
ncbi:MAG TPA: heparinase II/III family protein [Thermomicrobiales bacterium]|nr:heparinase II/III family protein [Thermomicrobiales bacterium]